MDTGIINIIIADDHPLFSDGLDQLLSSVPGYRIIEKVDSGMLLLQVLNRVTPDLILLDNNMPLKNGLETAAQIRKRLPSTKIIFITMYDDPNIVAACRQLNINGFITKNYNADIVKETIAAVLQGETVYMLKKKKDNVRQAHPDDLFRKKFNLSPKEIEIVRLIKEGKSNKDIEKILHKSVLTIESQRKTIFRKLGISKVTELVKFAFEQNI